MNTQAPNSNAAQVVVRSVSKTFTGRDHRSVVALGKIDLTIHEGEFVAILGPSGCGKSTLLNILAGFSLPTSGEVVANSQPVTRPGPDRGMVFQEYALFPWMTVAENVAFGLELKKMPNDQIRTQVDKLLDKLQLLDFRDRFPKDLSGGMKQRVAIARVLALDPPIMLMDEPFGALDALTRRTMQDELLRIWTEFRKTIVFVTHGIDESIYLADRVVIMTYRPGTIKQIVRVTLDRPRDSASPSFTELQREIAGLVMEEQMRLCKDEERCERSDPSAGDIL
ncbi:MAG TPA: ABC transporter ATP-binding protein [Nitrospirota bacterium]|nr:ABC transporter ATP-binding protein [Nitrospirota bacterium]